MKICCTCKKEKDKKDFWKNKHNKKDGLHRQCKNCMKEYAYIYRNKEETKKWFKEYLKSEHGKIIRKKVCKKHYENNKHKSFARGKFLKALKKGKFIKPKFCEECTKLTDKLEAHHEDYSKWDKVIWLCIECHKRITFENLLKERGDLCLI
jgi:hypothetical protein